MRKYDRSTESSNWQVKRAELFGPPALQAKKQPDAAQLDGLELARRLYGPPPPDAHLSRRQRIEKIPAVYRSEEHYAYLELADLIEAYGLDIVRQAFKLAVEDAQREAHR